MGVLGLDTRDPFFTDEEWDEFRVWLLAASPEFRIQLSNVFSRFRNYPTLVALFNRTLQFSRLRRSTSTLSDQLIPQALTLLYSNVFQIFARLNYCRRVLPGYEDRDPALKELYLVRYMWTIMVEQAQLQNDFMEHVQERLTQLCSAIPTTLPGACKTTRRCCHRFHARRAFLCPCLQFSFCSKVCFQEKFPLHKGICSWMLIVQGLNKRRLSAQAIGIVLGFVFFSHNREWPSFPARQALLSRPCFIRWKVDLPSLQPYIA